MTEEAEKAIRELRKRGIDGEVRCANSHVTSFSIRNLKKEPQTTGVLLSNIGVRVYVGGKVGFASSPEFTPEIISRAVSSAAVNKDSKVYFISSGITADFISESSEVDPDHCEKEISAKLKEAQNKESVVGSAGTFTKMKSEKIYACTQGSFIRERKTSVIFSTELTGKKDGEYEKWYDLQHHIKNNGQFSKMLDESISKCKIRLSNLMKAGKPILGRFNTVLDPEMSGLFAHEAVGHSMEADHLIQKSTLFKIIDEEVAPTNFTLIDDPTLNGAFGSYSYDDEGFPSKKVILIRQGRVNDYLQSRETAEITGNEQNGHGRAGGISDYPYPRMGNTIILPGDKTNDEILSDGEIILFGFRGGEVDTSTGNFFFSSALGQKIKNGEPTEYFKGVSMRGFAKETLLNIGGVCKDIGVGFPGFCGKNGQNVSVETRGPSILLKNVVVA